MKLEDQVCSLDLAKKLKELGVKQESIFAWLPPMSPDMSGKEIWSLCFIGSGIIWKNSPIQRRVSAFTVAELGEMLPPHFPSLRDDFGSYDCFSESNTIKANLTNANTEADARAKMLIYLLENGLVKIK